MSAARQVEPLLNELSDVMNKLCQLRLTEDDYENQLTPAGFCLSNLPPIFSVQSLTLVRYDAAGQPCEYSSSAAASNKDDILQLLSEVLPQMTVTQPVLTQAENPAIPELTAVFLICRSPQDTLAAVLHIKKGSESAPNLQLMNIMLQMFMMHKKRLDNDLAGRRQSLILSEIMNRMQTSLMITDPQTGEILYMNPKMREAFQLRDPIGQICWKTLQSGMTERCSFCPIPALLQKPDTACEVREAPNTLNGRLYRTYDSLMEWTDHRLVHFQHAIDVTDSRRLWEQANTDELTLMPNRRQGLARMRQILAQPENTDPAAAVMIDINELKTVNDQYGHSEGDDLIRRVSTELKTTLQREDLLFRLSGDEFFCVFLSCDENEAHRRMQAALKAVRHSGVQARKPYLCSFCYGIQAFHIHPEMTADALFSMADQAMYVHKRRLHIERQEWAKNHQRSEFHRDARLNYDPQYLYEALVDSTDDYLFINNMQDDVFLYPQAMAEEFDLPGTLIRNAAAVWGDKVHPHDKAAFLEANQIILDGRALSHNVEYRARNRRGEWVWMRCRGRVVRTADGRPVLFAGFISNLSLKNKTDRITGLFNSTVFESEARRMIEARPDTKLAMMLIGMDDFRHINDLYDRQFGDEVLRISAQKIQSLLPENASIYRLSGDEFGVLISGTTAAETEKAYQKIKAAFQLQQEYENKKYFSTLSAGCAFYPTDGRQYLDLFKYAGYALEHAKNSGKNRIEVFNPQILALKERSLGIIEQLRSSIDHEFRGFSLAYQPQVTANDGRLCGAEALARWHSPWYGAVSPMEFIPLLEESGMIGVAGRWIFNQACRQIAVWNCMDPNLTMSINLSYLQLSEPDFIPFMKQTLAETGARADRIIIEMTESVIASRAHSLNALFQEIHDLGIRIAMDDFGTGYSSLEMLKKMPADIVKVDRAFVKDILTSNFDASFIQFIVSICHHVDIQVCLEGVETAQEYERVVPMEVDCIQGYYFGRPMTPEAFEKRLRPDIASES